MKEELSRKRVEEIVEKMFPYGYSYKDDEYVGVIEEPADGLTAIMGVGTSYCVDERGVLFITCYYWCDTERIDPYSYVIGLMRGYAWDLVPLDDKLNPKDANVLEFGYRNTDEEG